MELYAISLRRSRRKDLNQHYSGHRPPLFPFPFPLTRIKLFSYPIIEPANLSRAGSHAQIFMLRVPPRAWGFNLSSDFEFEPIYYYFWLDFCL